MLHACCMLAKVKLKPKQNSVSQNLQIQVQLLSCFLLSLHACLVKRHFQMCFRPFLAARRTFNFRFNNKMSHKSTVEFPESKYVSRAPLDLHLPRHSATIEPNPDGPCKQRNNGVMQPLLGRSTSTPASTRKRRTLKKYCCASSEAS